MDMPHENNCCLKFYHKQNIWIILDRGTRYQIVRSILTFRLFNQFLLSHYLTDIYFIYWANFYAAVIESTKINHPTDHALEVLEDWIKHDGLADKVWT